MKMNRSILIAAIVLSNIASNAFAVLRPPYRSDRIITIGDMNNFKPKTQTQNPQEAMPLTNAVKELYRLAMREGHATRDFSAIYDYLTSSHDGTTIDQRSPAPAKAQLH
jgi:hypothetical protein